MMEARNIRRQFLEFLSLAAVDHSSSSISGSKGGGQEEESKRWGPLEFSLMEEVQRTKGKIDAALRHDFDTPEVIRLLQSLVSYGHVYIQKTTGRKRIDDGVAATSSASSAPVREAIGLVADCLEDLLGILGLTSVRNRGRGEGATSQQVSFLVPSSPRLILLFYPSDSS